MTRAETIKDLILYYSNNPDNKILPKDISCAKIRVRTVRTKELYSGEWEENIEDFILNKDSAEQEVVDFIDKLDIDIFPDDYHSFVEVEGNIWTKDGARWAFFDFEEGLWLLYHKEISFEEYEFDE